MDRERLMQELLATFVEELDQHVEALDRDLLALERTTDGEVREELLHAVFRTAHTIKGASRAAGVTSVEDASHVLETKLSLVRSAELVLSPTLLQRIFEIVDALREVAGRLRRNEPLGDELGEAGRALSEDRPSVTARISPSRNSTGSLMPRSPPSREASLERLDSLLARSAELRIAHRALDGQDEVLRSLVSEVAAMISSSRLSLPSGSSADSMLDTLKRVATSLEAVASHHERDLRVAVVAARRLDDQVRALRLVPFSDACRSLPRVVRDLASTTGKQADFLLQGGEIEIDRGVVEGLRDPLLHLIRNAVDHGLETPEERARAGKTPRATVLVAATIRGGEVAISVSDDGRGLDHEAIRARVRQHGWPEPQDDRELERMIFRPGFSTAGLVTAVSGRGVGLDIVRQRIEELHGTIKLRSQPGLGTFFDLVLPMTITSLRAVLVEAQGVIHAIAGTAVRRFLRVSADDVRTISGAQSIELEGRVVPLASLARLLGGGGEEPTRKRATVVILETQHGTAALMVDAVLAEAEIVVKPLGARLAGLPISGSATLLADGRPALILSAAELVRRAYDRGEARPLLTTSTSSSVRVRVLLVDDSLTTRTLEKSILESAGYAVVATVDGAEAFRVLQEQGADVVVSDVEMPNLDGIGLTEAIRKTARFRDLPVVLVTARGSDEDRARGMSAGANAYLVKSAFDQEQLLETLARLL